MHPQPLARKSASFWSGVLEGVVGLFRDGVVGLFRDGVELEGGRG